MISFPEGGAGGREPGRKGGRFPTRSHARKRPRRRECPFCTINPSRAAGPVPGARLAKLVRIAKPQKLIHVALGLSGWIAPKAAGIIHTDFERRIVRAKVYTFDGYVHPGGEAACRAAGLLRVERRGVQRTVWGSDQIEEASVCTNIDRPRGRRRRP